MYCKLTPDIRLSLYNKGYYYLVTHWGDTTVFRQVDGQIEILLCQAGMLYPLLLQLTLLNSWSLSEASLLLLALINNSFPLPCIGERGV